VVFVRLSALLLRHYYRGIRRKFALSGLWIMEGTGYNLMAIWRSLGGYRLKV
jgi:hypothetical protein